MTPKIRTVAACAALLTGCIIGGMSARTALAAPVITAFSSTVTSGTATNRDNDQDLMYLMTQGGTVTFQVTATGVEAYEWRVNKSVQAGATGNSLTWTVPNEKGIWEIHLKVTGGGAEAHQEWVVSTMSASEAPDFFEYFTDFKHLVARTEKDPWNRQPKQWQPYNNMAQYIVTDSSKAFVRRIHKDGIGDSSELPISTPFSTPFGTWKFKYRFPDGNTGHFGFSVSTTGTTPRGNWKYGKCSDTHHHCTIGGRPECAFSFDYDGGGWPEDGKWHQVTIIRTADKWLYMYNDYFLEFYVNDKLELPPTALKICASINNGHEIYVDSLEFYQNKYMFPNTEVSFGNYTWNYCRNSSDGCYYPQIRQGIIVKGRNISLSDIATALNDPSKFSYNAATKTATCNADLVIHDGAQLSMQNETLIFNCSTDGERHFVLKYATEILIENSTITTANDHYFIWNNASSTTHYGRPIRPERIDPIEFQRVGSGGGIWPLGNAGVIRFTAKNSTVNNAAHIFWDSPMELDISNMKFTNLRELDIGNYDNMPPEYHKRYRERLFLKGDKSFWVFIDEINTNKFNLRNLSFSGKSSPVNITFMINALRDKLNVYDLNLPNENIVVRKSLPQVAGQSHTWEAYIEPSFIEWGYGGRGTGMDSKLGLVNCKFKDIVVPTDKAWAIPKYYLDVKVINQAGQPVHNATVNVTNEVDNENYPAENMKQSQPMFYPGIAWEDRNQYSYLSYQLIQGLTHASTVTGSDGHTPLPQDTDNTMVLADFVQDNSGKTDFTYEITVEKDSTTKTVTGVNPGPAWYRPDADKPTYTVVIVLDGDVAVCNRRVFYNNSAFDSDNPAANADDDGAVAPDKTPLLPGGTATFANYTAYSRGINGIMVDIVGLPGAPTAADFTFKVGNDNTPGSWSDAPAPSSITVRAGAGLGGSDRITIVWADNAIQKQWLQVTVKATTATGLAGNDVFYFGNAIGETGNSATDARVTPTDQVDTRNNPHTLKHNPAGIDDAYDFNRDKKVGPTDEILARNNGTNSSTALHLITAP